MLSAYWVRKGLLKGVLWVDLRADRHFWGICGSRFSRHRMIMVQEGWISGADFYFLNPRADRLNPLNLYVHDRLSFFSLPLCAFLTPSIEVFISFYQHSH